MQCHSPFDGVTTSEGVSSSWNGQRPIRSAPAFFSSTPERSTSGEVHLLLQPLDDLVRDARHLSLPDSLSCLMCNPEIAYPA
jgi:hypothetical protein